MKKTKEIESVLREQNRVDNEKLNQENMVEQGFNQVYILFINFQKDFQIDLLFLQIKKQSENHEQIESVGTENQSRQNCISSVDSHVFDTGKTSSITNQNFHNQSISSENDLSQYNSLDTHNRYTGYKITKQQQQQQQLQQQQFQSNGQTNAMSIDKSIFMTPNMSSHQTSHYFQQTSRSPNFNSNNPSFQTKNSQIAQSNFSKMVNNYDSLPNDDSPFPTPSTSMIQNNIITEEISQFNSSQTSNASFLIPATPQKSIAYKQHDCSSPTHQKTSTPYGKICNKLDRSQDFQLFMPPMTPIASKSTTVMKPSLSSKNLVSTKLKSAKNINYSKFSRALISVKIKLKN